jgi:hypothetical protein
MKQASTGLDGDRLVLDVCLSLSLLGDHRLAEQKQRHYYCTSISLASFLFLLIKLHKRTAEGGSVTTSPAIATIASTEK